MTKVSTLTSFLVASVVCAMPGAALAHTGVGGTTGFGAGFAHPVGGADHLLAMVAVGLWAAQMGGRARWIVPGVFVGVMVLAGALGTAGVPVPFVEAGILASVLVLGLLITAAFTFPLAVSALAVAVFAVFHGHAHGTEMPLAIGGFAYSAGFAVATALLHACGIAVGIALDRPGLRNAARAAGGASAAVGLYLTVA